MRMSVARRPAGSRDNWTATSRPPATVALKDSDGATLASIGKGPQCTITGPASELVLFLSGRDAVQIEFTGDDTTVEQVRAARRTL